MERVHADEIALLRALSPGERAAAFARIWSLKEAYLKAAGTGLAREPASFAVSFVDATRAAIADPEAVPALAAVETRWQRDARAAAAVSAVILAR